MNYESSESLKTWIVPRNRDSPKGILERAEQRSLIYIKIYSCCKPLTVLPNRDFHRASQMRAADLPMFPFIAETY